MHTPTGLIRARLHTMHSIDLNSMLHARIIP